MKTNSNSFYFDENNIRITAFIVCIAALIGLRYYTIFIFTFLSIDFFLRGFTNIKSPLAFLSQQLGSILKTPPHPIFAPPKKFAAKLGTVFSVVALIAVSYGNITLFYVITGILIVCALLESVFKVCVGCYFYSWLTLLKKTS